MRRGVLVAGAVVVAVAAWAGALRVAICTWSISDGLDKATVLATRVPRSQATIVYDRHGRPAFSFFVEQRTDVTLDQVSPHMIDALLAVEDRRFFSHHGIDPFRVAAAAWRNIRAGRIVEGGSTITQQLARATQLSPVRTYSRKMQEILIAARMEQRFTKSQILEEYLNTVYFGEGLYGVEAAARGYFNKEASALQTHEAALLAALVRSPSADAPTVAPKRAKARRNLVLRLMRDQGRLSDVEFSAAAAFPIPDSPSRGANATIAGGGAAVGRYFEEEIRRQLVSRFGSDQVLRAGLRVYSTYDPVLQREAEAAITSRIAQIVKMRPRARGLQGSLVAMDPVTGDVLALVGGRDFSASSFNRATQARRQAGSAFKPIIYAAAMERGFAPGTLLRDLDTPIAAAGGPWLPAGDHERAQYTLRRALRVSSNRAAAQVLQQIGVTTAVYYAHRLGIESDLPMVPSLALGTGEVTLLELTSAYTAFANRGLVATPRLITRVEDSAGVAIHHTPERRTQAISPTTAFLMSSMLSDVINSGTGYAARTAGFTLPAAGKTGTTDDYADAWFVGYTPHLVSGVWFGLDLPAPIMRGGFAGVVAAPAWGRFMRAATAGAAADWYDMPSDVEKVTICRLSGARASDACRHPIEIPGVPVLVSAPMELDDTPRASLDPKPQPDETPVYEDLFSIGSIPSEVCQLHSAVAQPFGFVTTEPSAVQTPLVEAAIRRTYTATAMPVGTSGRIPGDRLIVERVVGADGVMRTVVKKFER